MSGEAMTCGVVVVELRGFEPLTPCCHAIRTVSPDPALPCPAPHQSCSESFRHEAP
jgi:hypothetical protein